MGSKRSHEGYLMLDNRANDGVPDDVMRACGLPAGSGHRLYECPSYTCKHCQRVVIMEPKRTKERVWCKKCDHYICDPCGAILHATGVCKTFDQQVEELFNAAAKRDGAVAGGDIKILIPD